MSRKSVYDRYLNLLQPDVYYIKSSTAEMFTVGLRAYVRINLVIMRITRGYFNELLELMAGLNDDQTAAMLSDAYYDKQIKWDR